MAHEKDASALSGWLVVFVVLLVGVGTVWTMVNIGAAGDGLRGVGVAILILDGLALPGLTVINPNEASVVTLFGVYKGTLKRGGFWWVNPLTTRRKLSLRVRNFESTKLKVNERDGNPIEIATVVVWRIVETFEAVFNVDDYENFVHVQSEAAVRNLATTYPYDSHEDARVSLRLSAGARLDVYSTFGESVNPRAALIVKPYARGNLKVMGGKAVNGWRFWHPAPPTDEMADSDVGDRGDERPSAETN